MLGSRPTRTKNTDLKKGEYFMYDIDDLIFGDNMEPVMSSR